MQIIDVLHYTQIHLHACIDIELNLLCVGCKKVNMWLDVEPKKILWKLRNNKCYCILETIHLDTFNISRNTDLNIECIVPLLWLNTVTPDTVSCINSAVTYIRSYHFIANSTSYSNAAGFWEFFSVPVISRIESIGVVGGWEGGWVGGGSGWGAKAG